MKTDGRPGQPARRAWQNAVLRPFARSPKPAPEPQRRPLPRPASTDRLYVIGDVHGRLDLLKAMFQRIVADFVIRATDSRKPKVVLVGDIVDRGDQSREVVDLLASIAGDGPYGDVTILKGNHEAALLQFLETPEDGASWLRFGGMQTLASYGVPVPVGQVDRQALRDTAVKLRIAMGDHVDFLKALPLVYRSGSVLCVHAGIDVANPADRDEQNLLWGRADFPNATPPGDLRVVHGHYDAPEPVVTRHRICVDTGAYYSGRLAAVRLDDATGLITVKS